MTTQNTDNMIEPKSAKPLRPLTNDPNYVINTSQVIHTTEQVLRWIDSLDSPNTNGSAHGQTRRRPAATRKSAKSDSQPKPKRQKTKQSWPKSASSTQRSVSSSQSYGPTSPQLGGQREIRVFSAIYGVHKPYKKHKQFSSDGFVTIDCRTLSVRLYAQSGTSLGNEKVFKHLNDCVGGKRFVIGGNEIEVADEVSPEEFRSGRLFVEGHD